MNSFPLLDIFEILGLSGVFAFAISGFLTASGKKLDIFGGVIVAFVTALGGGTLRDVILNLEVSWVVNPIYLYVVVAGAAIALIFKNNVKKVRKTLFLFDTIGISLFTISGVQIALEHSDSAIIIIIFGVMTATFGGVIRDILCNEIPLLFRQEIYASACIAGALCYVVLNYFPIDNVLNTVISASVIAITRTISVIKGYKMPVLN